MTFHPPKFPQMLLAIDTKRVKEGINFGLLFKEMSRKSRIKLRGRQKRCSFECLTSQSILSSHWSIDTDTVF